MSRRALWALALGLSGICVGGQAQEYRHRWQQDFWRNNCWPQPFQTTDRELTRAPLIVMTAAGWRQNNTLSDHFFNTEDQSINQAGELKLRWIVTQAPPHRRTVFVLRGHSQEATNARVAAVHRAVEKFVLDGPRPDVLITTVIPPGASGDYFDQVDRQLKQSIPAPRLPDMQATSSEN
jgi:hypothetical protein